MTALEDTVISDYVYTCNCVCMCVYVVKDGVVQQDTL